MRLFNDKKTLTESFNEKLDEKSTVSKEEKVHNLYLMDRVLRSMNDEYALSNGWLQSYVADGDSDKGEEFFKDTYMEYIDDGYFSYEDAYDYYKELVSKYGKSGILSDAGEDVLTFVKKDFPDIEVVKAPYTESLKETLNWDYFDKFNKVTDKYMHSTGEGDTQASQLVTAINKLIYKWFNDGDVYDNTAGMEGWANDLSSYANWLAKNIDGASEILKEIFDLSYNDEDGYVNILGKLANAFLQDTEYLESLSKLPKEGSIYSCSGPFTFKEGEDE